jgi:hypothetical protein
MVHDEIEMKWRRVADELRDIAQRIPRGPTRDKLFRRANQLEESAMIRKSLTSSPFFPSRDDPREIKLRQ